MASAPTMLAFDLKRTDKVEMGKPLREYIAAHHDTVSPDEFVEGYTILQALRESVRTADASEASAEKIIKYWAHTCLMGPRFPFGTGDLDVTFVWYDPFRSSRFSSNALALEQASVLFNFAAVHGQMGAACNRTELEEIKKAFAHFQTAAGVFAYLREHLVSQLDTPVSPEFTPEALKLGENLFLAQAQEAVYEKAVKDGKSDAILSMVAQGAAEFYELAHSAVSSSVLDGQFHVSWKNHLQMRMLVFRGAACYHQGAAQGGKCEYGVEIAFLYKAKSYVATKTMSKLVRGVPADIADLVRRLQARIEARLAEAESDNDKIYCEAIPEANRLPAVKGKALVKALPLPEVGDVDVPDLFARLVPIHIYTQVSMYSDRVESLVRSLATQMDEASDVANSTLASLNLPAAIEALDAPAGVPPALASKASTLKAEGGVAAIAQLLETRRMLASMNADIRKASLRFSTRRRQTTRPCGRTTARGGTERRHGRSRPSSARKSVSSRRRSTRRVRPTPRSTPSMIAPRSLCRRSSCLRRSSVRSFRRLRTRSWRPPRWCARSWAHSSRSTRCLRSAARPRTSCGQWRRVTT
ncbi:ALG-2 interacting protein X [Thecamonas trahens ATCC 50062]|uniref:ALG-2 interacting protein X n=1 Tax=Thecamonas trahens ATCC 50062 TaxID=461836 RepID=A0A0L0D3R7_THETB|nr:ALG-2 interacting protein X [Thecamonas trahens ATCC 50062]KNC46987.1 ALG-2 interacting protein X [Thecamonas trahens ATCC 50062]|eukprot:XP_013752576.1 ALG-2 interacting protein X [Thecamonas trahens ATCC 50062]